MRAERNETVVIDVLRFFTSRGFKHVLQYGERFCEGSCSGALLALVNIASNTDCSWDFSGRVISWATLSDRKEQAINNPD